MKNSTYLFLLFLSLGSLVSAAELSSAHLKVIQESFSAEENPLLAAVGEFNKAFPNCGRELRLEITSDYEFPAPSERGPYFYFVPPTSVTAINLIIEATRFGMFAGGESDLDYLMYRKAYPETAPAYFEKEFNTGPNLWWLGKREERTRQQHRALGKFIDTVWETAKNNNTSYRQAYILRYFYEPEVVSYAIAVIDYENRFLDIGIMNRCD